MHTSFLTDTNIEPTLDVAPNSCSITVPTREAVKILVMGSPRGVTNIIHTLYHLGFAKVDEWSPLQPTPNPGEVMSILIRQIVLN